MKLFVIPWEEPELFKIPLDENVITLKKKIENKMKIDIIYQTLIFSKKIMEDDKKLEFYIDENVVNPFILLKLKGYREEIVKINIKYLHSSIITIDLPYLSLNTQILEIKEIIEKMQKLPQKKLILLYSGETLVDFRPVFYYTKQKKPRFYMISDFDDLNKIKEKHKKPDFFDDSFIIGKCLSSGTFGKAYKLELKEGYDQEKIKDYIEGCDNFALKIINDDKDDVYMIGLLYGVIHLKELHHPNIMRIFDLYFEKDVDGMYQIMIIMEGLEETLDSYLKKKFNISLNIEEIIKIFTHICQGLLYLFSKKMVHMDLKPANIMRDSKNVWKLIDYDTPVSGLIDQLIGTNNYNSPEYRDFEYTDEEDEELSLEFKMEKDVWSLGVILYYMIYLDIPYFIKKKEIYPINADELFLKGFDISDKAKDLLISIFQRPEKRIKLKDIINHPFLNELEILKEVDYVSKMPMNKLVNSEQNKAEITLTKPFSRVHTIWHDPNVLNNENKEYLDKYREKFDIHPFADFNETDEFLRNYQGEDQWFVITSGKNCKNLLEKIHQNSSIIGIIIFCLHPEWFKDLPPKYKKIIKITDYSFGLVLQNIRLYLNYYLSNYIFSSIDSNHCYDFSKNIKKPMEIKGNMITVKENNDKNSDNIKVSHDLSLKFSIIMNSVFKMTTITTAYDFKNINEELKELKDLKGLKGLAPEEIKEIDDRLCIKEMKEKDKITQFQSVMSLFTCNQINKFFNNYLLNDNYDKIINTLTYMFLSVLDKDITNNKVVAQGQFLYRVTKKKQSCEYRNNHTMFWKTFSTTTESLSEAKKYLNNNKDGTIFEIRLAKDLPHPHLKLDNGWSAFPKEKIVLLWPYFAFHTIGIRKEDGYEYVVLQQDEQYCILQSNLDSLKKWWKNYILDRVELPFCDFFKRLKFKINDAADFNSFYQGNITNIKELLNNNNTKDKLVKSINEMYMNNVKKKLLLEKDKQQNQKRLYDILIRDMNILKVLEDIISPYLLVIVNVMWKLNDVQEISEIFEQNRKFFNELKNDVLKNVQELMEIYQKECKKICCDFFENHAK